MEIKQLTLWTADLLAQQAFYTEILGFASLPMADSNSFACAAGTTTLIWRQAAPGERPLYHLAFAVPRAHFAAARQAIATATPLVVEDGEVLVEGSSWNSLAFYFFDPAGNILECITRYSEPALASTVVPAPAIRSVAEIGLVCNDVRQTAPLLQAQLGIQPYHDSGETEFLALGADSGLLILVRLGRIWYRSNGMPSIRAPVEATLEIAGRSFELHWPEG